MLFHRQRGPDAKNMRQRTPCWGKSMLGGLCATSVLVSAGCMVGPDFVRPQPPGTNRYLPGTQLKETVSADKQVQHFEEGAKIAADWWQLFKSPKLSALITEAIVNNQNLKAAQASLRQSQHNLRAGYGIFYPQADFGGSVARQRFSAARFGAPTSAVFNLFTLSVSVSYALDVFGGQRRAVESLAAQRDFQRYTVLATYLTLSGNIVNAVIARAAYDAQIQATQELIVLLQEQISIAETQTRAGTVPYINLVSLKTQLAALEATLPPLAQKRSQTEHLLATLMGHAPGEGISLQIDLADLSLPADLPVTLPSELVRERPDILAAEAQVHQYSANIGVATAEMLPSFTLSGTYGQNNRNLLDIFMRSGNFWSVGAAFVAPIFHGGQLWFQRKAAIDAYQQSLSQYRQTALDALGQVADLLLALDHDAETLQSQSQELDLTQETMQLVQTNYKAGLVNYLQVLTANSQYFQAKIGYIQTLAQRFQDTSALFVALGGGWWNAEGKGQLSRRGEVLFNPGVPQKSGNPN
ncbi:efflux transporter, outer membrane factor (OMF) lipoprotein, NodT family [Nitrosovibrio tenuis]|uniref:Efflux transporter, outer membrane factor (OMF) lipoprotein, NodT family n=2 Tax=Nitrosovibrio tenuis TaxID=1233 RepID=A0A1H7IX61_9PROT|nr:efflux transporter, outer membrane factor (OMF) lipoprotein, NodT family [Nitrosovibrio tenuis]